MGSCLMDMEFQFEKMKKFCWWMVVRLWNNTDLLNVAELYT
jgi:hypothetical protein